MQLTLAAGFVPFSSLPNTVRVLNAVRPRSCGPRHGQVAGARRARSRLQVAFRGCCQPRWVPGWPWPRPGWRWPGGAGARAVSALHRPAPAAPGGERGAARGGSSPSGAGLSPREPKPRLPARPAGFSASFGRHKRLFAVVCSVFG